MRLKHVFILRGVPGSGKSHVARQAQEESPGLDILVVSADDYFVDAQGRYNFEPDKLPEAHANCYRRYLDALTNDTHDIVIVDNQNTERWEFSPYILAAQVHHVPFELWHVKCPTELAAWRNVHGVPEFRVKERAARFEPPLPWWPSRTLDGSGLEATG